MFAAEFEPAPVTNRRRSPHLPAALDAGLEQGGLGRTLCEVLDISLQGCRLQSYSALRRGAAIWLTLPGHGRVAADVIWAADFIAGCRFRHPLTQRALDALLSREG